MLGVVKGGAEGGKGEWWWNEQVYERVRIK